MPFIYGQQPSDGTIKLPRGARFLADIDPNVNVVVWDVQCPSLFVRIPLVCFAVYSNSIDADFSSRYPMNISSIRFEQSSTVFQHELQTECMYNYSKDDPLA